MYANNKDSGYYNKRPFSHWAFTYMFLVGRFRLVTQAPLTCKRDKHVLVHKDCSVTVSLVFFIQKTKKSDQLNHIKCPLGNFIDLRMVIILELPSLPLAIIRGFLWYRFDVM